MKLLAAAIVSLSLLASSSSEADPTKVAAGAKPMLTRDDVRKVARRSTNMRRTVCSVMCGSAPVLRHATAAS